MFKLYAHFLMNMSSQNYSYTPSYFFQAVDDAVKNIIISVFAEFRMCRLSVVWDPLKNIHGCPNLGDPPVSDRPKSAATTTRPGGSTRH